mgnify:CR=1 FL=1
MSLNYIEAIVVGAFQGVTELFPVSSLGHSILVPALVGGQWAKDLDMTADKSPYLAFLVAVHVATAVALLVFFWKDWVAVAGGLFTSIKNRKITTSAERILEQKFALGLFENPYVDTQAAVALVGKAEFQQEAARRSGIASLNEKVDAIYDQAVKLDPKFTERLGPLREAVGEELAGRDGEPPGGRP